MKILPFIIGFLFLMSLSSAIDTSAPMPYPVYGSVTIENEKANGLVIQLLNTKTGETIEHTTEQGDFVMDLSEFKKGWSASNEYKITYCLNDIRCSPESMSFMLDGDAKDLSKDLQSTGVYCLEGNTLKESCEDGTEIVASNCVNGKWVNTGNLCESIVVQPKLCDEGAKREIECQDGSKIVTDICISNSWEHYDTKCPEPIIPPTSTNWGWVIGIIAVLLLIVGLVVYFSRRS